MSAFALKADVNDATNLQKPLCDDDNRNTQGNRSCKIAT